MRLDLLHNWSVLKSSVEGLRLWVRRTRSDITIMRGDTEIGNWWTHPENDKSYNVHNGKLYSTHSSLHKTMRGRWFGTLGYLLILELMTKRGAWCASASTYSSHSTSKQALQAWRGLIISRVLKARKFKYGKRTIVAYQYKGPPLSDIIGSRALNIKPTKDVTAWINSRHPLKTKVTLPYVVTLGMAEDLGGSSSEDCVVMLDYEELVSPYKEPIKSLVQQQKKQVVKWEQHIKDWLITNGLRVSECDVVQQAILEKERTIKLLPKGKSKWDDRVVIRTPSLTAPKPIKRSVKLLVELYQDVIVLPTGSIKHLASNNAYYIMYRGKGFLIAAINYYATVVWSSNYLEISTKNAVKYLIDPMARLVTVTQNQVDSMVIAYKRSGTNLSLSDWLGAINPLL